MTMLALLVIASGPATAQSRDHDHMVVLATGQFPPHISADLPDGGSFTRIVREAFSHSGYGTDIHYYPWKRAWKEALELRADGSYSWSPKEERKKLFHFSDPVGTIERRLFTAKQGPVYASSVKELTGKSLCRPLAYSLHGQLRVMADNGDIHVQRPEDMKGCFRLAARGRVDFVEADHFEGLAAIIQAGYKIDDMRLLNIATARNPNGLIIAKSHPRAGELLSAFNAGLAALRRTGRYAAIIEENKIRFINSLKKDTTN